MAALAARIAIGSLSFMVMDGLWLGLLMTGFYRSRLAHLARMANGSLAPDWSAALAVYLCLGAGIAVFVVPRATSVAHALGYGAIFGLVVYGVYDFTNLSTLRDWPVLLTVVDIGWGMVASAVCAAVAWKMGR
jgi:uncharacterized membrane protein